MAKNIDDLIFKLQNIEHAAKDMRPVMKRIASNMAMKVRMRFKEQREPEGNPWVKSKRALKQNGFTLADTGRLKSSVTYTYDGAKAVAGTNVKYAPTMQFGARKGEYGKRRVEQKVRPFFRTRKGKRELVRDHARHREVETPWGNIPSRKFLGMTKEDKIKYLSWIKEELEK